MNDFGTDDSQDNSASTNKSVRLNNTAGHEDNASRSSPVDVHPSSTEAPLDHQSRSGVEGPQDFRASTPSRSGEHGSGTPFRSISEGPGDKVAHEEAADVYPGEALSSTGLVLREIDSFTRVRTNQLTRSLCWLRIMLVPQRPTSRRDAEWFVA